MRVFADAVDLAIVLKLLMEGLRRVLPVFALWGRVSGLRLRPDRSIVVPLCERGDFAADVILMKWALRQLP